MPLRRHSSSPLRWSLSLGAGLAYGLLASGRDVVRPGAGLFLFPGASVPCIAKPPGSNVTWPRAPYLRLPSCCSGMLGSLPGDF